MEVNNAIIITACVVGFIIIGWIFNISLSKIFKLILNSILGGILIYIINYFGASIGMHIGLNLSLIHIFKIPVIGNGDVKTAEDARKMFEYTGVDGIMIGRGILGEPWKINDIIQELTTGQKSQERTPMEKLKIIKEHIELEMIEKGEYVGVREMRKHICWYLKNLPNSSQVRQTINMLENKDEVISTLEQYFKSL